MLSYVHGTSSSPLLGETIGACFDRAAGRWPDIEAVVVPHQGIRWTYRQLKQEVDAVAAGFLALGLQPGERVGIWIGISGWWIGFMLVTLPETFSLWRELLGGIALSLVLAYAVEQVMRRTAVWPARFGAVAVAVGLILVYYTVSVEPALQQHPEVLKRLRALGSVTSVPLWLGVVIAAAGGVTTLVGLTRRPSAAG